MAGTAPAMATCQFGNGVQRVIYLQFDNVHLRRDKPEVPSDLEQIPSLLNFMQTNGTLLTNHHTPLISHTSVDTVTSLTGVYGEKFGFAVGDSFGYFDGTGTPHFTSSFAYWNDLLDAVVGTKAPIIDKRAKVHPAPWVPYTRAGCDVGAFAIANVALEVETTPSDIANVFGPNSPQEQEYQSGSPKALPDFEGIAIHCTQGSTLCTTPRNAVADVLPDEPGGYIGYQALFGNKYVAPVINNGLGYVLDLDGNHIANSSGFDGFPGFSPTPSQSERRIAKSDEMKMAYSAVGAVICADPIDRVGAAEPMLDDGSPMPWFLSAVNLV
jgi:hypothetical protein